MKLYFGIPNRDRLKYSSKVIKNKNLTEKYRIERDFHNKWAKSLSFKEIHYKEAFESPTSLENRFAISKLGNIKDKKILDLGCGMGDATLYFAFCGAKVYALDISPQMIKLVNKLAKKYGFTKKIYAKVGVAEKLPYETNTFDFVYGNGILHHAVPSLSLREVHRVLKPHCRAVFVEPLSHNPIINVYRNIANGVRTSTEKPLDFDKLEKMTNVKFNKFSHKEFHFFTLLIFIYFYFIDRVHPNKERYWKKIINEGKKFELACAILNSLDRALLFIFPFMGRYFWNTVLVYEK